jgi:surfactin synthase thioesterase subunit
MNPDYLTPDALTPIALTPIQLEQIKRGTRERPELVAHVVSILQRDLAIVTQLARRAPSVLNAPVHAAIRQALIDLAAAVVKQAARTRWSPVHASPTEVRQVARGLLRRRLEK